MLLLAGLGDALTALSTTELSILIVESAAVDKGEHVTDVTAKVLALLVPHAFEALTLILPFCPALPAVTCIKFVPCPLVIVQPLGTAQLYAVALLTAEIL